LDLGLQHGQVLADTLDAHAHPSPPEVDNFGAYDDNIIISADFTQPANTTAAPGEWATVPLSADVSLSNEGWCNTNNVSLTVYYVDDTPSFSVQETDGGMAFWIDDMLAVKNITFSIGPVLFPGPPGAVAVQYEDVSSGEPCLRCI
jgi:hypothetical protein